MESLQLPRASQGTASAGENNPDAQPDISTFQRFKELPLEIRRLVWIYALPGKLTMIMHYNINIWKYQHELTSCSNQDPGMWKYRLQNQAARWIQPTKRVTRVVYTLPPLRRHRRFSSLARNPELSSRDSIIPSKYVAPLRKEAMNQLTEDLSRAQIQARKLFG